MNLRRAFLWSVLGSLVLAAGVGIWAVLFDIRSERWMASMLSVALFSLLALGAAAAIEKRVWVVAMRATIALCTFGTCLFIYGIWNPRYSSNREFVANSMGLTATWTIALAVAGMLAIMRFNGALAAIRLAGLSMVFVMAVMFSVTILAEPRDQFWFRCLGSAVIATTLVTVAMPILYRVKGIKTPRLIETARTQMSITCPRCLLLQTIEAGDCQCARCRLKFKLEIEEPRCPECDYLLYRLTSPRCPECGYALAPDQVEAPATTTA
jgi:hypothetical protein